MGFLNIIFSLRLLNLDMDGELLIVLFETWRQVRRRKPTLEIRIEKTTYGAVGRESQGISMMWSHFVKTDDGTDVKSVPSRDKIRGARCQATSALSRLEALL